MLFIYACRNKKCRRHLRNAGPYSAVCVGCGWLTVLGQIMTSGRDHA